MLQLSCQKSAVVLHLPASPCSLSSTLHISIALPPPFSLSTFCLSNPQLENGPHAPVYQLLNLFAYGTYCDYKGIFITDPA